MSTPRRIRNARGLPGAGAQSRHALRRPSISPLLWAAGAAWFGSRAGTEASLVAWATTNGWPLLVGWAAVAGMIGVAAWRRGAIRLCAAALAGGLAVSLAHGGWLASTATLLEAAGTDTWDAVIVSDPREGAFGTTLQARLDAAPWGLGVTVTWPKGSAVPAYGRRVLLSGRLKAPARMAPPSADAFRRGDLLRISPWKAEVAGWDGWPLGPVARWRGEAARWACEQGGVGSEILASMLFGVPPAGRAAAALEDAKAAGVAWAVTASGLHLAALVMLADRLAAVAGLQRRGRAIIAVLMIAGFAIAAGLRLSLIRAAAVASAATVSRALGRRRDATAALGATLAVLFLLDPSAAYDSGLMLGALAVSAIALFGGLVASWLAPAVGRSASRALGPSVAAQVAVGPLTAAMFGGVAVLGPLALVGSAPLVGGAVTLGFVGASVATVSGPAGVPFLRCGAVLAESASRVWGVVAGLPTSFIATPAVPWWIAVVWACAAAWLWLRWPVPRRAARVRAAAIALLAALVVPTLLTPPFTGGVDVLDIGQGDAVLVRDGTQALLVDTGPDPVVLRRALARAGVHALDGVVLTHAHADHTGGVKGLAGVARPAWIGVPDVVDDDVDRLAEDCASSAGEVVRLRRDMTWYVGETSVRVLWPRGGERNLDANDTSVVLLLERRGRRALLLGDAEDRAQRGALEGWSAPVDMLKVAHHGSPNGNVPTALALWAPPLALISVGAGNTFGHPSRTALDSLSQVGATVRRTDQEGDLIWTFAQADGSVQAAAGRVALCDNRYAGLATVRLAIRTREAGPWPPPTCPISNPSISSMAPRSCCWNAPRSAFASASPLWPIWTSTWSRSREARPPPPTSSTPPTRCRS